MGKQILTNDWAPLLETEFSKEYYLKLREFLKKEYTTKTIYPDMHDIFNALHFTPYSQVRVVILGQDPYHGPGQAHGLCFSVKPEVDSPPSLVNIFKELKSDLGCKIPDNGHLTPWAKQGVLLLNAVLTVEKSKPLSHQNKGWEIFTDKVIDHLNRRSDPVIFLLWGSPARKKRVLITEARHYVIEAPHPSPFSAHYGFFGHKPFSKTNDQLKSWGLKPLDWQIPDLNR